MTTQVLAVGKKKPSKTFGPRLRAIREAKGLTVAALADLAGMQHQAVSRIERGEVEPKWSTVLKFADALGVEPNEFKQEE